MAYKFSELAEELKKRGLDVAEEAAKQAADAFLEWIKKSAQESENKFDDLILAVEPMLREQIDKQIDKIDGEEG